MTDATVVPVMSGVLSVTREHDHGGAVIGVAWLLLLPLALAAVAYLGAAAAERSHGRRAWPWYRDVAWSAGLAIVAATLVGPLADAAHEDLAAHMVAHLLAGMLAPLLLVAAAPVTLALRSLDVGPARRLSRLLASAPLRVLTHPVVAATIAVGSLWLLYATPLAAAMRDVPLVHELVIVHVVIAGYLFTASIVSVDPAPHRAGYPLRLGVLVLAIAAHSVLAKHVFAVAPTGTAIVEAERAGLVMYYGGDAVELVLLIAFFAEWYRSAGRRLRVGERRALPGPG
ncbi:cytochrome c oxidase assembly protein [Labedella populi]|nr:cytochrome c oxidase assembly protein [Labedella populi]